MPRIVSTSHMIEQLEGLVGTTDLTPWEADFLSSLIAKKNLGQVTSLTANQLEVLERIYRKHFA
jgi:hypothetical protein